MGRAVDEVVELARTGPSGVREGVYSLIHPDREWTLPNAPDCRIRGAAGLPGTVNDTGQSAN